MDEEILDGKATDNDNDENKGGISSDLIRGHINTIILRTLYDRDKYGYEIIEEIESKSKGQYSLKQPTLYSALKRLESQGYINAYWKTDEVSQGGRRKYYTLTENGKAVTERNQAEWEYSRSVIDNLISDRSFDFTQPPPTQVDMKILKNSTSRVPVVKADDETEIPDKEPAVSAETVSAPTEVQKSAPEPVPEPVVVQTQPEEQREPSAEERQKLHENYLRIIHSTADKKNAQTPFADNINTEKLIYNNKPETERDYRNLIGNLFDKTVANKNNYAAIPMLVNDEPEAISINVSEYRKADGAKKATYDKFGVLFKTSLIIFAIMLLEFALSLIFKNDLGVNWSYPFVILVIGCIQLLIFGVLHATDTVRSARKPIGHSYLTATIFLSVILIVIVFLVSILLNVDYSSIGDIFAKIIIPSLIALNIPIFACIFSLFSK